MESERFRITLNHSDGVYVAGETIKAEIALNLAKRTKIRAIKIQTFGKGRSKWIEILPKNYDSIINLYHHGKQIYEHRERRMGQFEPLGQELDAGIHTYQFSIDLDSNLPSSFKGTHGVIKFKMRIIIQRSWSFDERHIIPLTIIKHMPLLPVHKLNSITLDRKISKTVGVFGAKQIHMRAILPVDYAIRGKPFRVRVVVNNESATNVEKIRFTVLQYICYYSYVPLFTKKWETVPILTKETGPVEKKCTRTFAHELQIPLSTQPTDNAFSDIIHISYELKVEAVIMGFFKNLILNLPFTVYSNESSEAHAQVATAPAATLSTNVSQQNGDDVRNVFTSSTESLAETSEINAESSSLHSTASDSSVVTLSPAVAGNAFSGISESSSQFNSPSSRNSLRNNSNVPYELYANSPLTIDSGLERQETPPPSISEHFNSSHQSLPTTSTPSYLLMRAPTAISTASAPLELPPSYEELFGTALPELIK